MNAASASPQLVTLAKLPPGTARTPPDSLTVAAHENSVTPLPISPLATILIDSSPRPFPHRTRRILNLIHCCYQGQSLNKTWERVRISTKEYEVLQNALHGDKRLRAWVADKLRYDHDSVDGDFVLRMPSPLHDIFAIRLQEMIAQKLKVYMEQEEVRMVIKRIRIAATADIHFGSTRTKDKKSPDGSFRFAGTKYPPLVIEVANSQKREDLPHLAESYIERTKGQTKTVITIDLEYRSPGERAASSSLSRSAVYSVYRNRLVHDEQTGNWQREAEVEVEDQHFRMNDLTVPAGSMRLLLSDFCPDGTLSETHDQTITVSHAELTGLLTEAEREEAVAEAPFSSSSSEESVPFVSKRKRGSAEAPVDSKAYIG